MNRSPISSHAEDGDADVSGAGPESRGQAEGTTGDDEVEDDDDFDDDFDEFEEGGEGDDFGDFDDGFHQGEAHAEPTISRAPDHSSIPVPSLGPVSQQIQCPDREPIVLQCMHFAVTCVD